MAAIARSARLGLFQIERVEPFGEPAVNWSKQFASLPHLALVAPKAREAHCGAEFKGFGLLLARNCECALEIYLRFRRIRRWRLQRHFAGNTIDLGLPPPFFGGLDRCYGFTNAAPSLVEFADVRICSC